MNDQLGVVTRALLRLYPPSFRARYGTELEALTNDLGVSRSVALDLMRGLVRAWMFPCASSDSQERRRWRLEATTCTVAIAWCVALFGMAGFSRGVDDSPLPGLSAPPAQAAFRITETAFAATEIIVALGLLLYAAVVVVPAIRSRRRHILMPMVVPVLGAVAWAAVSVGIGWALSRTVGGGGPHDRRLVIGIGAALLLWAAIGGVMLIGCAVGGGMAFRRARLTSHLLLPGAVGGILVSAGVGVAATAAAACIVALDSGGMVTASDLVMPSLGVILMVPAATISLTAGARGLRAVAGGLQRPAGG